MLKGLKKIATQPKEVPKKKAGQNSSQQIEQLKVIQQQALKHFLNGSVGPLGETLSEISKKQQQLFTQMQKLPSTHNQTTVVKRAPCDKFSYNIDFEEEDGEEDNKKSRHKKRKLNVTSQRNIVQCPYCPENQQLTLLSASNYVYLALPKLKTFRKHWHFILAPIQHQQTTIGLEEDVLQELKNYKKCLLQMFDQTGFNVVFIQQFYRPNSHIFIECLALPLNKSQDLPFFFKQALEDIEGNWSTHRNIIDIRKEKGGLQKQIPKKISYFYIDFSLGHGYAHVIQNEKQWNPDFVYEVLAPAIGLEKHEIKTTEEYMPEELHTRTEQFQKMWSPFDWTILLHQ